MMARHIARHGGEPERSLAAVSSVSTVVEALHSIADPDIDASLRFVLNTPTVGHDETLTYTPAPSSGVRYQRVRYHAKGGLGEVFVARDTELNREVALKEIQPIYADDLSSRNRFVVEAEITGGLEHPGIVPIYGLGHYDNGRPFYAMRFIKGDSLKDAIDNFHKAETPGRDPGERILSLQKLLRRFLDVCDAIEYAHSRGILHRDLKPNNVMVGKYGETLVVDWGLAKSVSRSGRDEPLPEATLRPSSACGSAETLPGSVIGTPASCRVEQAAPVSLFGRAAMYSQGGALPPCSWPGRLAPWRRRPPCSSRPGGAVPPTPREVVGWLGSAEAGMPSRARWREAGDPLSFSAVRRGVGAAGREQASRRSRGLPGAVSARWARRNRTAVSSVVVALLAALVGLSAVAAVQTRANRDLKKEKDRTAAALVAETKAKQDTQAALSNT